MSIYLRFGSIWKHLVCTGLAILWKSWRKPSWRRRNEWAYSSTKINFTCFLFNRLSVFSWPESLELYVSHIHSLLYFCVYHSQNSLDQGEYDHFPVSWVTLSDCRAKKHPWDTKADIGRLSSHVPLFQYHSKTWAPRKWDRGGLLSVNLRGAEASTYASGQHMGLAQMTLQESQNLGGDLGHETVSILFWHISMPHRFWSGIIFRVELF